MKVRNNLKGYEQITLDFDSHVETVYGNQQRAKKGYNPKKPGRKSFHPLFCFIGETRDFLWGRFRPGNRYSGQGARSFLNECLKIIPRGIKNIRARGDSSFFDEDFLQARGNRGRVCYSRKALSAHPVPARRAGVSGYRRRHFCGRILLPGELEEEEAADGSDSGRGKGR